MSYPQIHSFRLKAERSRSYTKQLEIRDLFVPLRVISWIVLISLFCRALFDPPGAVFPAIKIVDDEIHRIRLLADLLPLKLYPAALYGEWVFSVLLAVNRQPNAVSTVFAK